MQEEMSRVHRNAIIVDGHCDTLLDMFKRKRNFWEHSGKGHIDWPRLKQGKVNIEILAIYVEPEYKPYGALARVLEIYDYFNKLQKEKNGIIGIIKEKEDLCRIHPLADCSFILAVEGGEALEQKISTLRVLFRLGFRVLTLTWNQRNSIADGIWEWESRGGLTSFGKEVVSEMNSLGMLIDVSHLSENGFWDVLEKSVKPIAATHSCCRELCSHHRNLTNDQLRALRENKGIVGINFYPGFLGGGRNADIERVINHLEHAVSIAGIEHVGIGSDFDGINRTPQGLEDIAKLPALTEAMIKRGWKEDEICKVMGGNFIRVLFEVLPDGR